MKKIFSVAALAAMSMPAFAQASYNTDGYESIKEYKAWGSVVEVYFQSGQEHQCSSSLHKARFRADASKEHQVDALLAAYLSGTGVSLSYDCDSNGNPMISGVRIRN